ncbi:MAG TPA: MerR family transcriptional regulator [Gemmataceae bacterium]|nr:MerR family transcriptional regulator [Gemmataceae bacterium]
MKHREALWTLDELCDRVERVLAVDYPGQASGRVRDVPDRRTIRYYTTLGLIDRPAAMRGRTGLYGVRHILQLAAVKRLQAQGLALADVQARLVGQTDAALRQLARLPADFDFDAVVSEPAPESANRRSSRFWGDAPAEPAPRSLIGVPLADGATLLVESTRPLNDHDLSALRAAAAPLLTLLRSRRLLADGAGSSNPNGDAP